MNFMRLAAGLAATAMVLTGCAKERPIKPVPKADFGVKQESKSKIDTNEEYMFVASTLDTGRKTSEARPHWMGEGERIKFQFTEDALRVIVPEEDGRFLDNPTNSRSVLLIPIEHVDYKCVEDEFGDCTRNEEENNEITWDKKAYFKLKPEELKAQQLEFFMPLDIKNWITGGGCFKDTATKLIEAKWENDAVNIVLEKTYQGSPMCMNWAEIEDLTRDFTFSVRYQYSFAKLKTLTDGTYKPANYTRADEGNFGFFNTPRDRLDIDNNDIVDSRYWLFDRWNPNRKVIYYLSEAFNKPEYKNVKKATYEAFTSINNALEKAGTAMRLELRDPVKGMSPADIRNNMIVMVEDPSATGVIGYGPHVSNPQTGEILHARTVMYMGVIKKYIRYDYDNIIDELLAASARQANLVMSPDLLSTRTSVVKPMAELQGITTRVAPLAVNKKMPGDIVNKELDIEKLSELVLYPKDAQIYAKDLKERIMMLSKHCEYPAELFNFENAIGSGIDEVIEEVGMKPWDALTEAEKTKVLDILIPYVWVPTFIHEMGHNLGLRHNFAGSEDVANFYTQAELKEMGVTRPFRYSSIMDYGYRVNNELRTMGKYDIAALRYGYAEKVELADGSLVSLEDLRKNPALELKPYAYCTDEHADVNPNCNRFDEGTNIAEIAQHYVRAYERRYSRANFRNNRRKFSLLRDSAQMWAIDDTMYNMRLMFERYEDIKNTFDLDDSRPEWQSIPFLKELREAAVTAGHFYLNVLKTPDLMCAVSLASKPNEVLAVIPIRVFSKRAITCFDKDEIQLNPQYVIVAEGGKNFQSRKDPKNPNPYADEIDVRGIWIDKTLATHYLFTRTLGSTLFDDYTENMMQMPELRAPILETLNQIVTDDLVGPVTFRTQDGFKVDFNVAYRLADANPADNSHVVTPLIDETAARIAGFSLTDPTLFHPYFVGKFLSLSSNFETHLGASEMAIAPYRAYFSIPRDGRESEYRSVDIGDKRIFARRQATAVMTLMDSLETTGLLGQLSPEQLDKVIAATDDTGLNELEKAARALGKETLLRYANGGYQAPAYYAMMLRSLAAQFN